MRLFITGSLFSKLRRLSEHVELIIELLRRVLTLRHQRRILDVVSEPAHVSHDPFECLGDKP